jgi:hypothetical protein
MVILNIALLLNTPTLDETITVYCPGALALKIPVYCPGAYAASKRITRQSSKN